jgi:glycosyltransferase involved in cell wall biosynthesis
MPAHPDPRPALERPIVAFADLGGGWQGGTHYLQNLFRALRTLPADCQPRIALLLGRDKTPVGHPLAPYVDQWLAIPAPPQPGFWTRQGRRVARCLGWAHPSIPPHLLGQYLAAQGVDVLFAISDLAGDGPRLGVPFVAWIPDFQYRHLPGYFPTGERKQRGAHVTAVARHANRVLLSSQDAARDFAACMAEERCEQDERAGVAKARVLPFVAQLPADVYAGDPAGICARYHLPERYFYLPNQFWQHKNHVLVLDALGILAERAPHVTVVCTGNTTDHRNPVYFSEFLARLAASGLRDHFLILGLVPQADTYRLMRQSVAVLQPSLFEGWSTTVEEAKSLGKPVILSDLAVHREQDPPGAVYFDPNDPKALARCLLQVDTDLPAGPSLAMEVQARHDLPVRTERFGAGFMAIIAELAAPDRLAHG